jgi:microcystin-dependent protein
MRVTTAAGALMFAEDGVPNPAPPEAGGGGGVSVATEQILQTGDPIWRLRTGTMAGFVRMNGRTIGNASSGATERANADTAALYTFLWDNLADAICPVAGGRGASAAADFAASKVITLPDMRGRGPFGLDDMGNSAAGRLSMIADWGVGNSTTIGSSGGAAMHTLATAEMPSHSHSGTTSTNGAHWHTYETAPQTVGIGGGFPGFTAGWTTMATSTTGDHNHVLLINNAGGGGAHNNMPPFALGTWFLKL